MSRRPLLFYSAWPLEYHNLEARRKAERFARAGYDVCYVAGLGTRNPRLSSARKLADRIGRKLRGTPPAASLPPGLRTGALAVLPPRQLASVRRFNEWWLARQVHQAVPRWDDAVCWMRWPTQELVAVVTRRRPALLVYESVDPNHLSPGIRGRWRSVFDEAERALVAAADLVVVPSPALADRYRAWGADPRLLPHGVDLREWRERRARPPSPSIGFVGTLDYRLDTGVVRAVAEARPEWHIRLIGPIQEGFRHRDLAGLPNVSVEAPVPQSEIARVFAGFDAGLLPYVDSEHSRFLAPVKALELLAAGTPVVARPNRALAELHGQVRFAATPKEFVARLDDALADASPEAARRRRAEAEANTWDRRLGEMTGLVAAALDRRGSGSAVTGGG